mmetsp:Transcript_11176/g.23410  ORF Transcript_11176/g.23410 Transcript_11176/m.23410 type:complete len:222 (-) Transcript_11176:110-775(-)
MSRSSSATSANQPLPSKSTVTVRPLPDDASVLSAASLPRAFNTCTIVWRSVSAAWKSARTKGSAKTSVARLRLTLFSTTSVSCISRTSANLPTTRSALPSTSCSSVARNSRGNALGLSVNSVQISAVVPALLKANTIEATASRNEASCVAAEATMRAAFESSENNAKQSVSDSVLSESCCSRPFSLSADESQNGSIWPKQPERAARIPYNSVRAFIRAVSR